MALYRKVIDEISSWGAAILSAIPGNIGVRLRSWHYSLMTDQGNSLVIERGCEFRNTGNIHFGRMVSIGANCLFDASEGEIYCGDASAFNAGLHVNASKGGTIRIGQDCLFGPGVKIFTANHRFDQIDIPIRQQGNYIANVEIGNNCWIGANAVLTAGIKLGDGVVIGAGAVVTSDIPAYTLAVGVPARPVKQLQSTTE